MSLTGTIPEPEQPKPEATAEQAEREMRGELPVIDEEFRTLGEFRDDQNQRHVLAILERTNIKLDLTSLEIMASMAHADRFDADHAPDENQFTINGGPADSPLNAHILENTRQGVVVHVFNEQFDMFLGLSHREVEQMRNQVREEDARPGTHMREVPAAPFPDGHGWAENNASGVSRTSPKL